MKLLNANWTALLFCLVTITNSLISTSFASDRNPALQQLMYAESDATTSRFYIDAEINQQTGDLIALYGYIARKDQPANLSVVFSPEKLNSGFVLYTEKGFQVISLKGRGVDAKNGGQFDMIYLYDGVFNPTYRNFSISIERVGPKQWQLYSTINRQPFSYLYLESRKILWKVVGIGTVEVK
jgi:hypothetical protein